MQIKSVTVRGIEFGSGMPKICVPIVGQTEGSILEQAQKAILRKPDCMELRIDCFSDVADVDKVLHILKCLRDIIGETVLLFTFRSEREGGRQAITVADYQSLCERVCQSGFIDLLDVEAFMQEGLLNTVSKMAHTDGVYVVGSNHDFDSTPEEQEIVRRLQFMDSEGADIPKIAVTPQRERDVLTLLSATLRYYEMGGEKPVITMSMKDVGMISRIAGEVFGSSLTFAVIDEASAPGQLPFDQVKEMISVLHKK